MDAKGDTVVVWLKHDGANSAIQADWRPAGGTFGTPITLSPPELTVSSPVVAMNPQGDTIVAWVASSSSPGYFIEVASRPYGGVFKTESTTMSALDGVNHPVVAIDSSGDAVVAYDSDNGGINEVTAASRPDGGVFERPTTISSYALGSASAPVIATDPAGDATVTWSQSEPGRSSFVQTATKPAGMHFGPATGFPSSGSSKPAASMNAGGETMLVWTSYDAEHSLSTIEAATRATLGGTFETPVPIAVSSSSEKEASAIQPEVAIAGTGTATAVWPSSAGVAIATRPPGAAFGKPATLLTNPLVVESFPVVAMDDGGDAIVVWSQTQLDSAAFLVASAAQPGGAFDEPVFLSRNSNLFVSEYGSSPISVAMDSHGDAVSAWVGSDGEHDTIQVAGYQAGGPQLEDLSTPSEGEAGSPLTFSVTPLSAWSTVNSTTWSWDDGTSATSGTNVTHTFHTPGVYHVSLTATDAMGNVTNAIRTVTIAAVPREGTKASVTPTHVQPDARGPKTVPPTTAVSAFKSRFATRASVTGKTVGLLVGIHEMTGVHAGDTILLRCIAICEHPLHKTVHVRRRHDAHGAISISPPLLLFPSTRIEIELSAPKHIARFIRYDFSRTGPNVVAHVARKGCISPTGQLARCP